MTKLLVDAKEFGVVLKTLLPFNSKEEGRYCLGGVYIHGDVKNGHINIAATDGHKLCVMQMAVNVTENADVVLSHILPTDAVKNILLMIKSHGGSNVPVELSFETARVGFSIYTQTASFKCVDGTFPDYTRVIPKEEPKFTIGLFKKQAVQAAKAVATYKEDDVMRWEFSGDNAPIKIVSENKVVVIMPARGESVKEITL